MSKYELGSFDRIVWNFPHGGFPEEHNGPGFEWTDDVVQKHAGLLKQFIEHSATMLNESGMIIITNKSIEPFSLWNIPKMAEDNGL